MRKTIRGGLMWAPCWKGATEGRDKVVCFFSFLNKQNVNMYSNCKNVNIYYKKRWPMLLKWGLFSRLPGLIVFRAIKTGICSPGWRQNNSNKTKWPMSSRLNNVLCVRQHMDFGNEFENCFPRFGKMVGKVSKLKTKLKIENFFPRFEKMVGKIWKLKSEVENWQLFSKVWQDGWQGLRHQDHCRLVVAGLQRKLPLLALSYCFQGWFTCVNVNSVQYTDELTPHVEWLEEKKTLANRCAFNWDAPIRKQDIWYLFHRYF